MTGRRVWFPIAALSDLPLGHVYQTRLCGFPLAVWRASAGTVNVWEDRCPHRGVRFSIGNIIDDELRCQYHAWRFASGTGACTSIPAHPRNKPAAAICARVYPAIVRGGLIWTRLDDGEEPLPAPANGIVLRSIYIERPAAAVEAMLQANALPDVVGYVQPVGATCSILRSIAQGGRSLVEYDGALERLRRELEGSY